MSCWMLREQRLSRKREWLEGELKLNAIASSDGWNPRRMITQLKIFFTSLWVSLSWLNTFPLINLYL